MRACGPALDALLRSTTTDLLIADVVRLTLKSGTVLRWADYAYDLTLPTGDGGANETFLTHVEASTTIPLFTRGTVRGARGAEVSTLELTVMTGGQVMLGAIPMSLAAVRGFFDRATVKMWSVYLSAPLVVVEALPLFEGRVERVRPSNTEVVFTVASGVTRLANVILPRRVIQPDCPWELYSAQCGANPTPNTAPGSVSGTATERYFLSSSRPEAAGYWDLGTVTFDGNMTPELAGEKRTITKFAPGSPGRFDITPALPVPPVAGDSFSVLRGCAKTLAACDNFANRVHFGGFPYAPTLEDMR